jgi:hypothetical protein
MWKICLENQETKKTLPVLVNCELNLTQTSCIRAKNSAVQIMKLKSFAQAKMLIDLTVFKVFLFVFDIFFVSQNEYFQISAIK